MTEPDHQSKKTIRQLREERGWSQLDLALQLGMEPGSVSAWERGLRRPKPRSLLLLSLLFGVRVEAIAFGPGEQP